MIIGILDSGVGGTSILEGLEKVFPNHTYIYHADSKNFPYSTKSEDELKKIATAKFVTLPDSISADEKKLEADLSAKTGADFDKAYVDAMVKDHKEDIAAFEEASKKVTYPELQAFITKTLPVLHKHLDAIQKIHDKMK